MANESNRNPDEPFEPALRPQFGLKALTISLVGVSLTFALSRWLPAAVVVAIVFSGGLVALHVFSTALGSKLRAARPVERVKRERVLSASLKPASLLTSSEDESPPREPDLSELRERRSIASLTSWAAVLTAGACIGVACGWSYVAVGPIVGQRPPSVVVQTAGLAAFGFLGALAGGLSHALAASLFVAHRQSVQASEAERPR